MPSRKVLPPADNFLAINTHYRWEEAEFVILPVALEQTVTYLKGAGLGPKALLDASHIVEFYDDELDQETFRRGMATLPILSFETRNIEEAIGEIEKSVLDILGAGKKCIMVGGEHSATVGSVRAFHRSAPGFSVLQLDAHADLREEYEGSPLNHACVMARIAEFCHFVGVGIRSLCIEEADWIAKRKYDIIRMERMKEGEDWMDQAIQALRPKVYITLDLDVLDPSVMPAVGTPVPGGLGWYALLKFLRRVFEEREVVGLDMVELAPRAGTEDGVFAASKLLYRCIGYWAKGRK